MIVETNGIGFSVQAVADRAGVTHRTIYNHFPTREALCDAFSDYVDELLVGSRGVPQPAWSLATIPRLVEELYRTLALRDRHARAYVMLMIGNRRPMRAWRRRSLMAEKLIAREQSERLPLTPRQVAAVIRMFVSTMGWHLLTEQCGLTMSGLLALDAATDAGTCGHKAATLALLRNLGFDVPDGFVIPAGVQAYTGSVLWHTAIVAREFALPAVVAAASATSTLVDGEEVTVDGTRGEVTRC